MALSEVQLAWRLIGISFYVLSVGLVLLYLVRISDRRVPVLTSLAGSLDARFSRLTFRHAVLFSALVVGGMTVLHWFTLQFHQQFPGVVNNYGDFDPSWLRSAQTVVSGGNPYSSAPGVTPNFGDSINFGIVFVGLNVLGFVLGGAYGIVVVYSIAAFLLPVVAYVLIRDYLPDPRVQGYAFFLALLIPQSVFYMERLVQDEPFTLLAVLGSIVALRRDRLLLAATIAGFVAAMKYAPIVFLAAFLIVHYKQETLGADRSASRSSFLRHVGALGLGIGIFVASMALGYALYGRDFLVRSIGMTDLQPVVTAITLVESLRHWIPPIAMNLTLGVVVLALCAYLFFRTPRPDPEGEQYLAVGLFLFLALSALFMKINPEYVALMIVLGLVYFLRRDARAPRPRGFFDLVYSPLFPLGLSVLADGQIWWAEFYRPADATYQGPWFFQIAFTIAFLVLAVELLRSLRASREPGIPLRIWPSGTRAA